MDYTTTASRLEGLIDAATDPEWRARAYAALTLARVLAPEWKHHVPKKDAKNRTVGFEAVWKPAGVLSGERADIERRFEALCATLV